MFHQLICRLDEELAAGRMLHGLLFFSLRAASQELRVALRFHALDLFLLALGLKLYLFSLTLGLNARCLARFGNHKRCLLLRRHQKLMQAALLRLYAKLIYAAIEDPAGVASTVAPLGNFNIALVSLGEVIIKLARDVVHMKTELVDFFAEVSI